MVPCGIIAFEGILYKLLLRGNEQVFPVFLPCTFFFSKIFFTSTPPDRFLT